MAHAKLSASGAKKWLNCPLSITLESKFPDEESEYAKEGTKAHELSELKLRRKLNLIGKDAHDESINDLNVDEEMDKHTDYYCNLVMEIVNRYDRNYTLVKLEERVDFGYWVPEGFGTSDVIVISDNVLEIIDLKYGRGVKVSADNNPQLMLYALGALNEYGYLCDIKIVNLTIIQPRLDNISTFKISTDCLLKWGEEIKAKALKAFNGDGNCVVGKHCDDGFCRARPICKAYADERLKIARYDFRDPAELSADDIADILGSVDDLVRWSKTIKDYALSKALSGEEYKGFKLVEGRSNRTFNIDDSKVLEILKGGGFKESEVCETTLKSLSSLEKMIGKKDFKDLLGNHVIKPMGKPSLVPIDDERPIFNSVDIDFKNI